jgi:hypothetical protein
VIFASALLAGAAAPAAAAAPLSERVPDTVSRFCVDILSRTVPVPAVGNEEQRVFARYGLTPGIPAAAMQAAGPAINGVIAGATLASGEALDGAFFVALGGAAGETCRVIVYRASAGGGVVAQIGTAMTTATRGWKVLPNPVQSPAVVRLSFIKRDGARRPFIANLIAPRAVGPVAMIANVAALPPTVTLPQGY